MKRVVITTHSAKEVISTRQRDHNSSTVSIGCGGRSFRVYTIATSQTFFYLRHDSPHAFRELSYKSIYDDGVLLENIWLPTVTRSLF